MASSPDTTSLKSAVPRPFPRAERRLQKKLRSTGQEYVSRTGKIVPAKKVPDFDTDVLCTCPQKCDERVPRTARQLLFNYFYGLADFDKQNAYLRTHLTVRSRIPNAEDDATYRQQRRITCKYLLPILPETAKIDVCQKAFVNAFVITEKRVRRVREKMFANLGLTTYHHTPPAAAAVPKLNLIQFSNEDLQQVQGGRGDKDNPLLPYGIVLPEGITIAPVTQNADHVRDIAIVNNFFSNQLWKPEYITS